MLNFFIKSYFFGVFLLFKGFPEIFLKGQFSVDMSESESDNGALNTGFVEVDTSVQEDAPPEEDENAFAQQMAEMFVSSYFVY